jgi:exosortase E/protease (VPEID-CTERM system)
MLPELISADANFLVGYLWHIEPLTRATFQSVAFVLNALGFEVVSKPADWVLSSNVFRIRIYPGCSGVEGLALTTLFFGCYFYTFKDHLRFPNVWVLLPLGLLLSWALNVLRIAALFSIGMNGNSELAVSGFHTHAGWLAFSILAFAVIGISTSVPWFRGERTAPQPLLRDWTAARTLPFAAFMAAALLLSTFTVIPDLWYVIKVLAMAFALAAFLPVYCARLFWRIDALAVAAGIAIGLLWIAFGLPDSTSLPLNTALVSLPFGIWLGWVLVRLVGTVLLVPVVEELMFRGYVLERFSHNSLLMKAVGLAISTGLFAVMHQRWVLATCAGLVYGVLYLRSHRVTDSIVAHSISNAMIGFYALATAQWSLI